MQTERLEKHGMTLTDFSYIHLDGVSALEKICFHNPWSKADLKAQIDNKNSHFLVALDGDTVAGYMGLQIIEKEGYVTNIAVLPQYRRQGIAHCLVIKSMKNEMDFITLEVRQSNIPAISLYASLGFERIGERRNFYQNPTENALIMTKYF